MNWGKAFSSIRKKSGRKQGEVATVIGISQVSLSQIELGKKKPSDETVEKFAKEFGLDVNYVALIATLVDMSPEGKAKFENLLLPEIEDTILAFVKQI